MTATCHSSPVDFQPHIELDRINDPTGAHYHFPDTLTRKKRKRKKQSVRWKKYLQVFGLNHASP